MSLKILLAAAACLPLALAASCGGGASTTPASADGGGAGSGGGGTPQTPQTPEAALQTARNAIAVADSVRTAAAVDTARAALASAVDAAQAALSAAQAYRTEQTGVLDRLLAEIRGGAGSNAIRTARTATAQAALQTARTAIAVARTARTEAAIAAARDALNAAVQAAQADLSAAQAYRTEQARVLNSLLAGTGGAGSGGGTPPTPEAALETARNAVGLAKSYIILRRAPAIAAARDALNAAVAAAEAAKRSAEAEVAKTAERYWLRKAYERWESAERNAAAARRNADALHGEWTGRQPSAYFLTLNARWMAVEREWERLKREGGQDVRARGLRVRADALHAELTALQSSARARWPAQVREAERLERSARGALLHLRDLEEESSLEGAALPDSGTLIAQLEEANNRSSRASAAVQKAKAYLWEQIRVLDELARTISASKARLATIDKVFHTGSEGTQAQARRLRSDLLSYGIHSRRNGVAVRNAADERTDADGKRYNSEVTGGVLQHSWFAAVSKDYETAADAIGAYAMGYPTPSNPAASASYNGLMTAAALANTGEDVHMTGNASLDYHFASDTLSVRFGGIQIVRPSDYSPPPDLVFNDLPVVDGEFNDQGIKGGFFGTEHAEVAGVFHYVFPGAQQRQYEQMHGAFGARRSGAAAATTASDPPSAN